MFNKFSLQILNSRYIGEVLMTELIIANSVRFYFASRLSGLVMVAVQVVGLVV